MTTPTHARGRKPISKTGELMKTRPIRMTDAEWEDAKLITMAKLRALITKAARRLRDGTDPS
jgi:hypothetical protein